MGDEDAVDAAKRLWQDLLTEVGSDVNEQTGLLSFHKNRTAQALVFRVCALTHLTLAAYHGHATRGSCSQESDFHLQLQIKVSYLHFLPQITQI